MGLRDTSLELLWGQERQHRCSGPPAGVSEGLVDGAEAKVLGRGSSEEKRLEELASTRAREGSDG